MIAVSSAALGHLADVLGETDNEGKVLRVYFAGYG